MTLRSGRQPKPRSQTPYVPPPSTYSGTNQNRLQWLTTHEPSTEHDLAVGLRENFDARARWKTAITGARALGRLNSGLLRKASSSASASASSGGWGGISDDDDDDEGAAAAHGSLPEQAPGENANVQVTPPPAVKAPEPERMVEEPQSVVGGEEEEELRIPGSFDLSDPAPAGGESSWGDMLRKMHLKQ